MLYKGERVVVRKIYANEDTCHIYIPSTRRERDVLHTSLSVEKTWRLEFTFLLSLFIAIVFTCFSSTSQRPASEIVLKPRDKGFYYAVLNVDRSDSKVAITQAYRTLAKCYHPDKSKGQLSEFLIINEAFIVLRDISKRSKFDKTDESWTTAIDIFPAPSCTRPPSKSGECACFVSFRDSSAGSPTSGNVSVLASASCYYSSFYSCRQTGGGGGVGDVAEAPKTPTKNIVLEDVTSPGGSKVKTPGGTVKTWRRETTPADEGRSHQKSRKKRNSHISSCNISCFA